MDHTARHGLPISNGYGSGSNGVTVYCGRCQGTFRADAEWAIRYFNASRRKVESDTYMGPGARADALVAIDAREAETLEQIASM